MRANLLQRAASLALLATVAVAGAQAQDVDRSCGGVGGALTEPIGIARVEKGRSKAAFVKSAEDGAMECPAPSAACRDSAYLVAGDVVLTLPTSIKDFVCSSYVNSKGRETSGWLPAAALEAMSAPPVAGTVSWLGTWHRTEAVIKIKPAKNSALEFDGSATWGAADAGRVARGAVNTGDFDGIAKPQGDMLLIAGAGVASFEKAGTCAVRMRRLGPYLLVEDNNACGGANVSFSGIYVRR